MTTAIPSRRPSRWRDQRGIAMLAVLLTLLILTVLGTAAVVQTTLDLRATSHYDTGNRALFAAEAGVLHAISTMNATGVLDFRRDVVDAWGTVYGTGAKSLPSFNTMQYTVTVAASAADPVNAGAITATGASPLLGRRVLTVGLRKGDFTGAPGAIYLAADAVASQFTGNAFDVDGNDHTMLGAPVPGGPVKPGISTRNDTVSKGVTNSLNNTQKDNVKGLGFNLNPLTPSVIPTGGPGIDDLDKIVNHLLQLPGVATTSQKTFNGNDVFGTTAAPKVTHMTNADVNLNGNANGAGVLIVDGSLTINGTLDFIGWIIVRGATTINPVGSTGNDTALLGNATIYGSLWTGDLAIKVGGSAIVNYCDQCLRLVDGMNGNVGAMPRPMQVSSWEEGL